MWEKGWENEQTALCSVSFKILMKKKALPFRGQTVSFILLILCKDKTL